MMQCELMVAWTEGVAIRILTNGKFRRDVEGKVYGFYDKLTKDYERKVKMKSKDLGLSSWNSIVIDRYVEDGKNSKLRRQKVRSSVLSMFLEVPFRHPKGELSRQFDIRVLSFSYFYS